MAEEQVIANQESILKNQNRILANQTKIVSNQTKVFANQAKIMANQKQLLGNQKKLDEILSNQKAIRGNQSKILANQGKILSRSLTSGCSGAGVVGRPQASPNPSRAQPPTPRTDARSPLTSRSCWNPNSRALDTSNAPGHDMTALVMRASGDARDQRAGRAHRRPAPDCRASRAESR